MYEKRQFQYFTLNTFIFNLFCQMHANEFPPKNRMKVHPTASNILILHFSLLFEYFYRKMNLRVHWRIDGSRIFTVLLQSNKRQDNPYNNKYILIRNMCDIKILNVKNIYWLKGIHFSSFSNIFENGSTDFLGI